MEKLFLYKLWQEISRKEKIKIAIDGSSYGYNEGDIQAFSYLNMYDQFEIIYISSKQIEKRNSKLRIYYPELKRRNEILIKTTEPRELHILGYKDDNIRKMLSIELIGCIAFADVAVTRANIFSKVDKNFIQNNFYGSKTFIGNLSECQSAIRGWINKGSGLSNKKDKFMYRFSNWYLLGLSSHVLLPYFSNAWRAAVAINEEKFPLGEGTLIDYLYAIVLRIKHILTTRDILEVLKINTFDKFNKKTENYLYMATYYFGYFLILTTAIMDSLCRITNWRLGRIIKKDYEISLRKTNQYYKKFILDLERFNPRLSNYISSDSTQSYLDLIYYLRNFIAHAIMPGNTKVLGNYQGLYGDLMVIQRSAEAKVLEFAKHNRLSGEELVETGIEIIRPTGKSKDDKILLEPILFTRYSVWRVMDIINIFFKYLNIERKMITEKKEMEKYDRLETIPPEKDTFEFIEETNKIIISIEASIP